MANNAPDVEFIPMSEYERKKEFSKLGEKELQIGSFYDMYIAVFGMDQGAVVPSSIYADLSGLTELSRSDRVLEVGMHDMDLQELGKYTVGLVNGIWIEGDKYEDGEEVIREAFFAEYRSSRLTNMLQARLADSLPLETPNKISVVSGSL